VGKVVQPLQSVNYHDSRAHGHERCGPFTQLVGFGWVYLGQDGLVWGVGIVLVLATRVRLPSLGRFWSRG
jgi:hypothetical protein